MRNNTYIVAIELSSSKVSGVVGVETNEGMSIIAAASTPVNGFISRGIVRNVDKTSEAISCVINMLESDLDNIAIKRAYVSFAGLSVHSITSRVSRSFDGYTKISQGIIDEMGDENIDTFRAPEGYERLQVLPQECRLDGKIDNNPIGAPTLLIECNYLNILMKEQFHKQFLDSFEQAKIDIAGEFSAARIDADILLSSDQCRNGCALVNIGAETTTITIYNGSKPRKLTVLPLGSNNITLDLTRQQISYEKAEEIKVILGYKSSRTDNETIDNETLNSIINGRMSEILKNVRYQIEQSGEPIGHIVFTGGGSKLKNLGLLLEEYLPGFTTEIKPEPRFNIISERGVNINGVMTTALCGLLKQGRENCCEEENLELPQSGNLFTNTEMKGEHPTTPEVIEKTTEPEVKTTPVADEKEKVQPRDEETKAGKEKKTTKKTNKRNKLTSIWDAAMLWFDNATSDEGSHNVDEDEFETTAENKETENNNIQ